jgi:S1-C subfamily serine protease
MTLRYTLVASLLLFCGTAQAQLSAEQCQRSVVSIGMTDKCWLFEYATGSGTGFFISRERVLTAAHIAKGATYVMFRDGTKKPCYVEKQGSFEQLDWAILRVPGANGLPLKFAKSETKGEAVWCYGDYTVTDGSLEVSPGKVTGCGDWGLRYADATIYPGYSGGPVIDRKGQIMGVISRYSQSDGTNHCIYVPIQAVKRAAGL